MIRWANIDGFLVRINRGDGQSRGGNGRTDKVKLLNEATAKMENVSENLRGEAKDSTRGSGRPDKVTKRDYGGWRSSPCGGRSRDQGKLPNEARRMRQSVQWSRKTSARGWWITVNDEDKACGWSKNVTRRWKNPTERGRWTQRKDPVRVMTVIRTTWATMDCAMLWRG